MSHKVDFVEIQRIFLRESGKGRNIEFPAMNTLKSLEYTFSGGWAKIPNIGGTLPEFVRKRK